jgi:uncharacterized membrane protein
MRFLFGPFLLFAGFFKILIVVLLIVFLVRILSHRHDRFDHGHWHGHHGHWDAGAQDPRRIAAMRYAAGKIDRAEFDRIMSALDASGPTPPTPPTPPAA